MTQIVPSISGRMWRATTQRARRDEMAGQILVVEDDRVSLHVTKALLEQAGYVVFAADNGVVALQSAMQNQLDVIFVDLYLPGMTGWQFLKKYREYAGPHTAVIAMSSDRNVSRSDFTEFLVKPFFPSELRRLAGKYAGGKAKRD